MPDWKDEIRDRLSGLSLVPAREAEIVEELSQHLEDRYAESLAGGASPEEAYRNALADLSGSQLLARELQRVERQAAWEPVVMGAHRRRNMLGYLWQDLRYAARLLRKSPGFTAVAVLTLALGIGANTAIFQLLDAVRLRSLPVAKPDELAEVRIAGGNQGMGTGNGLSEMTNPLWEQVREHQEAFSGVFAWGSDNLLLGEGAQARIVNGLWVSGEMFPVLGVLPHRGRLFGPADDRRGCGPQSAVISYAFWQSEFAGLDSAIGKRVTIADHPFEVIGVTPREFFGLEVGRSFDVALPICVAPIRYIGLERADLWWLTVMGRLKPGWTLEQAASHFNAISPGLIEATVPTGYDASVVEMYRNFRLTALPAGNGISRLRMRYERSLWLLLGITGLVLLIACANLANLMLARANARQKEIAVRLALGASRARLISQLLAESMLLAAAGTLAGAWLAGLLSRSLVRLLSAGDSLLPLDLSLDWRVLAFTAAVAIITCLVFGLLPSIRSSRTEPSAVMKLGGRGLTADREGFSFQRFLVVSQMAISLVLLAGALLLVRSFLNLITLDPGFRQDGIIFATFSLDRLRLPEERRQGFKQELVDRIKLIPQIEGAAITTRMPLDGSGWSLGVRVPGAQGEKESYSRFAWVSPGYFSTMEIPILAGRDFDLHDTANSRKVLVVNETFVRQFFNGASPIGAMVRSLPEPTYPAAHYEVVGVVRDTKYSSLREEIPPIAFAPASQLPNPGTLTRIAIRTSTPLEGVIAAVRQSLGEAIPQIPIGTTVLREQVRQRLVRERLMAWLSGFCGALAVMLAVIGLYGVISYMVARRRNEIGVRLALGAQQGDVVKMVIRQGLALAVPGIALGMAGAFAGTRVLSSLLFEIAPTDPGTLIGVSALLTGVTLLACYIPARRAASVDPMVVLREE
jgi:putative ABC transport system permease protein